MMSDRGWGGGVTCLPPHLQCLFLVPVLGKGQGQKGVGMGKGDKVRHEGERGLPRDSHWDWLRKVELGSWEQASGVGMGLPQSL